MGIDPTKQYYSRFRCAINFIFLCQSSFWCFWCCFTLFAPSK